MDANSMKNLDLDGTLEGAALKILKQAEIRIKGQGEAANVAVSVEENRKV